MNVIRCKNGHFFDGDSYEKCPHCGESVMGGVGSAPRKEDKKGFWGRMRKEKEPEAPRVSPPPTSISFREPDRGDTVTDVLNKPEPSITPSTPPLKKTPTLDFWQTSPLEDAAEDVPATEAEAEISPVSAIKEEVVEKKASVEVPVIQQEIKKAEPYVEVKERPVEQVSSLRAAVRNASASNEGKTMSYFSSAASPAANQSQPKKQSEPIVGWLVCVGGYHFGECFSIYAGKNSIGRSEENRIVIPGDNSISRSKHALIVYEPKKRNFFLQPGDSSGLTYLNDDYITESHKLSSHDMIELGDSKLMFVPLCGEAFSWEEHMPKGE